MGIQHLVANNDTIGMLFTTKMIGVKGTVMQII